jgi:hypothetical protein
MGFMEAIPSSSHLHHIFIAGIFAYFMIHSLMVKAPFRQSVYTQVPGAMNRSISERIVACWTFSSIRTITAPLNHPETAAFPYSKVPRPRAPSAGTGDGLVSGPRLNVLCGRLRRRPRRIPSPPADLFRWVGHDPVPQ